MSGRFVRASKYRHVFGRSTKKDQCYDNLRVSKNAFDTNLVQANPKYISVNWEAGGGGAFAVVPLEEKGKLPERIPLFRGHTASVLDTDWSPFDDSFIASSSEDGKILLWKVPEDFTVRPEVEEVTDVSPAGKLSGHSRKVGHVLFNPSAQNVLASASGDYTVKLWDVDAGSSKLSLKHGDIVQSQSWSANGSLLVTTCRDKKLRVWDVRQEKPAVETPGHSGAKNSRAVWMGEHERIATTGFSKMSDRQLGLWDIRAPREPLNGFEILDQISGVCMPFWDEGTQCLFLAGKGDGNIRYYEYDNDKFEYLSQYSSPDPQRGIAFMPKRGINLHENEVTRAFKTVNDNYIEPISFIVPRRAEAFQNDIYPPTVGLKPAMPSSDWFAGKEGLPPKISLESIYEGEEEPQEMPSDYKPASTPLRPASPPKAAPKEPEPEPKPAARGPTLSMKDNQASMADMADKYADKDEDSQSDDESSSFEEVSKPERLTAASASAAAEPLSPPPPPTLAAPATARPSAASPPRETSNTATTQNDLPRADNRQPSATSHRSTPSGSGLSGASEGLKGHLSDIKGMLEEQKRTILMQSEKIDRMAVELDRMRGVGGAGGGAGGGAVGADDVGKDEKIRMLELELEEARS